MEDKKIILDQIKNIENSIQESEKFFPFNYTVLTMWGVMTIALMLGFEYLTAFGGLWFAIGFTASVIIVGVIVEHFATSNENKSYDIENYTKLQKFVEANYTFSVIFAMALTYVFVSNGLSFYAYASWLFLIGFSDYISGFVINSKKFTAVGIMNISVSVALVTLSLVFSPEIFDSVMRYITAFFLGGAMIYLGISCKKRY